MESMVIEPPVSNLAAHERPAALETAGRYQLYAGIHKGLRLFMCEALVAVGRVDADDSEAVRRVVGTVEGLLELCRVHLHGENQFIHTAMEARRPGSACGTAQEHVDHERAIERVEAGVRAVERSSGPARARALAALYRQLALFVADNFEHMNEEETHNQAVLWEAYTDAELQAIEDAIVASHAPEVNAAGLRWMVPAMTPSERAGFMWALRVKVPAQVFSGMLALVMAHLSEADATRLAAAVTAGAA